MQQKPQARSADAGRESREVILLFSRRDDLMHVLSGSSGAKDSQREFILVKPGELFRRLGPRIYQIRPGETEDYRRVIEPIRARRLRVLFLWNYDASCLDYVFHGNAERLLDSLRRNLTTGLHAVSYLRMAVQGLDGLVPLYFFHHGFDLELQPQNLMVSDLAVEDDVLRVRSILLEKREMDPAMVARIAQAELDHGPVPGTAMLSLDSHGNPVPSAFIQHSEPPAQISFSGESLYLVVDPWETRGRKFAVELARRFAVRVILLVDHRDGGDYPADRMIHEVHCEFVRPKSVEDAVNGILNSYGDPDGLFCFYDTGRQPGDWVQLSSLILMDELTRECSLDFFLIHTPETSAGSFAAAFARLRESMVRKKKRTGRSWSVRAATIWEALDANSPAKVREAAQADSPGREQLKVRVSKLMLRLVADVLKVDADSVSADIALDLESHDGLHFDSILLVELAVRIEKRFAVKMTPVIFFQCRTLRGLVDYLMDRHLGELSVRLSRRSVPGTSAMGIPTEWNRTEMDYPRSKGVHHLIEEQAIRTPDADAVRFGGAKGPDARISYAQLNRCADRIARELREEGVTPGTLVGVFAERSIEMVIGLLGILKAGGAYVPLDPAFPAERLSYMVRDAQLEFLVTLPSLIHRLPSSRCRTITVKPWETTAGDDEAASGNKSAAVAPEQLAYVIYTSGSTGNPKGVMIAHGAFCNFLVSMLAAPGFTVRDCLLAVTTVSFDIAGLELFLPLIAGGCVDLVPDDVARDGILLRDKLERSKANVMQATPATWQLLLAAQWKGKPNLKMLSGGDALSDKVAASLLEFGGELWNMYGPTETTVWSSIARILSARSIHIGRPIGNTRFYVLDEKQQPVPSGAIGELYIGGDGLALGYLNDPELSRQKFIPDPFHASEARMYRTGDAVRLEAGGLLNHLGRFDFQVKIRGFRVELGEIESAIRSEPGVSEAVAVLRREESGHEFLIAFVLLERSSSERDLARIRERLKQHLPPYMLPSRYVVLNAFPMTLSGKIDRRTLSTMAIDGILNRFGREDAAKEAIPETKRVERRRVGTPETEPIAVIGLAARMPQSENAERFWEHLLNGNDLITEIPADRWDWQAYYGDPMRAANKTRIKWGGFVNDIDKFDASFFRISPLEARFMDPQQRMLLEVVWAAIEDAGYAPGDLGHTNTGTYVGVATQDYLELMNQRGVQAEAYSSTGTHTAMIANRISYFFDFFGPSQPVNTACSSSLAAIHRAVQALRSGECELAIAGGVNALLTPSLFISFDKAEMLCEDGRCKAFSDRANGYVRSEGVGVVLLKPLRRAIGDRDSIHAVIRGSAENHGGRSNSLRAPNPLAQARLLEQAYEDAGVDPATVSYIECHGTGTELGDPIEIEGLKIAFASLYARWGRDFATGRCGLGSVKSNAGHLEAAAGIAGLVKVLFAMKHRELPASLHCETPNRFIDLNNSPFHIVNQREPWHRLRDERGDEIPLRAGVSGFGFGGSNAHLVLEEYAPAHPGHGAGERELVGPFMIPLSARNEERLNEVARDLRDYLVKNRELAAQNLMRIAFTLQAGREAMESRLALLVESARELEEKLSAFLDGSKAVDELFQGSVQRHREALDVFNGDEDIARTTEAWFAKGKYSKLLRLWVNGFDLDWNSLYRGARPHRISLPTYPFARERHWIDHDAPAKSAPRRGKENAALPREDSCSPGALMFCPVWKDRMVSLTAEPVPGAENHVVMLCGMEGLISPSEVEARFAGTTCIDLSPAAETTEGRFVDALIRAFGYVKDALNGNPANRIFVQTVVAGFETDDAFPAISGFFRSVHLENPGFCGQVIEIDAEEKKDEVLRRLEESRRCPHHARVRYARGRRLVQFWEEMPFHHDDDPLPWKEYGVYLITGGAGGLGLLFAEHIAGQARDVRLILTGRSDLSADHRKRIQRIASLGSDSVEYRRVDMNDRPAVEGLVASIENKYGSLSGILHGAGIIRDDVVIRKTENSFRQVLAPKVAGTINLDRATRHLKLDFLVFFSSCASVLGNAGQADYAAANAFMDCFAAWRNERVTAGERHGRTLSINWPLWHDGGMQMDGVAMSIMQENTGLGALKTSTGIQALIRGLAAPHGQVMVMEGDTRKIRQFMSERSSPSRPAADRPRLVPEDSKALREKIEHKLKVLFAEFVQLPADRVEASEPLADYGLDSLSISLMNQHLKKVFGDIPKTLFYQYRTLRDLAGYFLAEHSRACLEWNGSRPADDAPVEEDKIQKPIAIIGLAGRYPGANSLKAFWNNLETGKRCITEIPARRWSLDGFYEADPEAARMRARSYTKWGGFLDGFSDFDPLFFNIPPAEALNMDPQERWMLTACWEAMEDGGYSRKAFEQLYQGAVGVFIGITKLGFHLHTRIGANLDSSRLPVTSLSSMANRVSYHLNLHGPSLALDTMCSSSLTALHQACEHLRRGDCRLAFAGAVNLNLHPRTYVDLCQSRMVTDEADTHCFSGTGRGFIPGEGVGAVLLKSLDDAIRDGDPIRGIIRGTAINHGGFTAGYTVPNLNLERELVEMVLRRSNLSVEDIDYIESAANGSGMGDAIEFEALRQAFRGRKSGRCPLGTLKPNIGHLEAASGMSQLTKVLHQMAHGTLAPTRIQTGRLDESLRWDESPFRLVTEAEAWRDSEAVPHKALITSFGAGGAYAAVVVEEYPNKPAVRTGADWGDSLWLILLSARTERQLKQYAGRLHEFLLDADVALPSLACTLQSGRDAMRFRLAVRVRDRRQLLDVLEAHARNGHAKDHTAVGDANDFARLRASRSEEQLQAQVAEALDRRDLERLAYFWLNGYDDIDWQTLYDKPVPRCSLPTYPFEFRSLWYPDGEDPAKELQAAAEEKPALDPRPSAAAVRAHMEGVIREVLFLQDGDEFDERSTFLDLGLDSISGIRFVRKLSQKLGLPVSDMAIFDFPTIAALAAHIAESNPRTAALPPRQHASGFKEHLSRLMKKHEEVVPLAVEGEGPTLVCIHPMSGDVGVYSRLAEAASPRFRVIGIRASGFLTASDVLNGLEAMGSHVAEIVTAIDPQGPVNLFGASLGGGVAYECARQLQLQGKQVGTLWLAEAPLIETEQDGDLWDSDASQNLLVNANFLMITMLHMDEGFRERKAAGNVRWSDLEITSDEVEDVGEDSLAERLSDLIRRRGVKRSREELIQRLQSMARVHMANLRSLRRYRARPLIDPTRVRSTLLRTRSADATSTEVYNPAYLVNVQRAKGSLLPFFEGWKRILPDLETRIVEGENHFDLLGNSNTVRDIADTIARALNGPSTSRKARTDSAVSTESIAVVGMSGRFPQCPSLESFWQMLKEGRSAITDFPRDRQWDSWNLDQGQRAPDSLYVRQGGFLERIDEFDPLFFQISPNEAELMDPSERLFLQESWKAIEDAGVDPVTLSGRTWGVFCGGGGDYTLLVKERSGTSPHVTGSSIPGRVSYSLNLTGPCLSVDAGCASSLLAIAQACDHLLLGKCEVAIAGGVLTYTTPNLISVGCKSALFSATGRSRVFDEYADGMMPAEGVGVLVLKPLSKAQADGDRIHGVLEGWGNNHNGKTNGISAPSAVSEAKLFTGVYRRFAIDPASIGFVEANATGTPLGDRIEIQALTESFRASTDRRGYCALGSVENNIGHAFQCSGIAHVMKVLLALRHREIPPTINLEKENPAFDLNNSPFFINRKSRPWTVDDGCVRRAAVSSFGATGANVHLVLCEAPGNGAHTLPRTGRPALIVLSAHSENALARRCRELAENFAAGEDAPGLGELSANLLTRRSHFSNRCALVVNGRDELLDGLNAFAEGRIPPRGFANSTQTGNRPALNALARATTGALIQGKGSIVDHLLVLADLYTQGIHFDLSGFFSDQEKAPLTLPGYPFEGRRCWIGHVERERSAKERNNGASPSEDDAKRSPSLQQTVRAMIMEITGHQAEEVDDAAPLSRLGLDSLMSMRLLSMINDRFNCEIHLVDLLTHNTIDRLSALIGRDSADVEPQEAVAPGLHTSGEPYSPDAGWFFARLSPRPEGMHFVRLETEVQPDGHRSLASIQSMIDRLLRQGIAIFHAGSACFFIADRSVDLSPALDALGESRTTLLANLPPATLLAPVSREQERALFHSEKMKQASWNIQHAYELTEDDLDLSRLNRALEQVAAKHDLLRTRFFPSGESWGQMILPAAAMAIESVEVASPAEFYRLIASERNRLLNVGELPLLKSWVSRIDRTWHLGFVTHHAIADAFTTTMLFTELMEHYHATTEGSAAGQPVAEQYWQYALCPIEPGRRAENERYWSGVLTDQPLALRLPYAKAPEKIEPEALQIADMHLVSLPASLSEAIGRWTRDQDMTHTQLFTAAIAALLIHGMGNPRALIHFVHNRRDRASLMNTPGEFSDVLFIPLEMDAGATVLQAARTVQRNLLNGLRHAKTDFARTLMQAGLDGYEDYFLQTGDVMVDSADIDAATLGASHRYGRSLYADVLQGLKEFRLESRPLSTLFFQILKADQRLHLIASWRNALLERTEMESLAGLVVRVVEEIVRAPGQSLGELLDRLGEPLHALREQSRRYPPAAKPRRKQLPDPENLSAPRIWSEPQQRHEPFPLNDIQESFVVGREIGPAEDRVGCHMYFELEMSLLDIHRLNRAWERLIERHEMLRAVILSNGQQKILKETPSYAFKVKDLRWKNVAEQTAALQATRAKLSHKVYAAECWPLFEIQVSICSGRKIIHFSIDEFIADASGAEMLLEEWQRLYEQPDAELPKLQLSFRDYLLALKQFENSKRYRDDLAYWAARLNDLPGGPELPRPSHSEQSNPSGRHYVRLADKLEAEQWQAVKSRAEQWSISPSALLLGLFAEVLGEGSGRQPFSIILTVFNRPPSYPELTRILGPFISTAIFVSRGTGEGRFAQRLRGVHKQLWESLDHGSVSGVRVLRTLRSEGRIPHDFAIPVAFNAVLRNKRNDDAESFYNKVTFNLTQTPQVYLDHQAYERNGALHFNWDVVQGHFDSDCIDGLFTEYCRILRELPDSKLWEDDAWQPEINPRPKPIALGSSGRAPDGLRLEPLSDGKWRPFPLTDQQQAYAFGRSEFGANTSSQVYTSFDAEDLDVSRLQSAWRKVMSRHEMLSAVLRPGGSQQVLQETPEYSIPVADLRGRTPKQIREALEDTGRAMISRICPLGEWPYFDLRVSRTGERGFKIHFCIDMIIADAQSLDVLLADLFFFYDRPAAPVEPLEISFREYALALKRYKGTESHRISSRYWDERFLDMPPGPQLPAAGAAVNGETYRLEGMLEHWDRLRTWAKERSVSPSMVLLTAYAEVLSAWSNGEPFTIVVPRWERIPLHPRIDEVVGDFTTMSWLVVDETSMSFEEKLMSNHRAVERDFAHRAVSGLSALRKSAMNNGRQDRPQFPVVFTCLSPPSKVQLPHGFRRGHSLSKTSHVDLDNLSMEFEDRLEIYWDVARGKYPEGLMEEMFTSYQNLLMRLAEDPGALAATDLRSIIAPSLGFPRSRPRYRVQSP